MPAHTGKIILGHFIFLILWKLRVDMADDIYRTIEGPSEGLYKEKGSKFLAYAWPVESEDEAKEYISDLRTKYYDARHHCFAWQLGYDGMNYRVYDDGEPSGTAGKPIHGQIRSKELTNILIVVVRYFGGTKLGVSGLIEAYKVAAADALANAKIIEKTINKSLEIAFPYESMNGVMRIIKDEEPEVISQDFNLSCRMLLSIRKNKFEQLKVKLQTVDGLVVEND